jgi:3-oxoacid CoA-transferase subunit A
MPIGGAHSIDKNSRIEQPRNDGWCGWWEDEEPTDEIKARVEARLEKEGWKIDAILSHTCPTQLFKELNKMNTISDYSILLKIRHGVHRTEEWLETIEQRLDYKKWYFGHFHKSRGFGRFVCLLSDILEFTTDPESG